LLMPIFVAAIVAQITISIFVEQFVNLVRTLERRVLREVPSDRTNAFPSPLLVLIVSRDLMDGVKFVRTESVFLVNFLIVLIVWARPPSDSALQQLLYLNHITFFLALCSITIPQFVIGGNLIRNLTIIRYKEVIPYWRALL
jgi:hypothetical protein